MAEAPIPLQLASGSTITSQVFSSSRNASGAAEQDAHQTPLCTPPSSARANNHSFNRRHSSVSYIRSGTDSLPYFRQESVDVIIKSPLSEPHTKSSQFPPVRRPGSLLSRNKSLSAPIERNVKDKRTSDRTGNSSPIGDSKMVGAMKHPKERPPVTLAEKHAELLHFIAQKESKCLELRSQLAVHEAELLQLKRKWELIVNHGFEKSQASDSTPSSTLSPTAPFLGPSTSAPYARSPHSASSPYFPLLPGGHAHAPVLEGIREGVQGMSRLIVAGFESIAGGPVEPSQAGLLPLYHPPLPLLLRSNSNLDRKPAKRHGQNESQSSSSTITSESTFASEVSATDTSRSSFSFDGSAPTTESQTSTEQEEKHTLENQGEQSKNSSPVSDRNEQVLMVCDTGATPTMSPNPDYERKLWSMKLNERQGGALADPAVKKNIKNEEDFDPWFGCGDSWDELPPSPRRKHAISKPRINAQSRRSTTADSIQIVQSSKSPPSLPPMSTIPGLATMNLASPAAQHVSSWMGSVGKKLGEIRGSPTFTKNQKRASLLLSDMQNTLVSSLISPTSASSSHSPSGSATKENYPVLNPIFASNFRSQQPTSASLLDEFDEDAETMGGANTDTTLLKTPVLVPLVQKSPGLSSAILNGDQEPCLETGSKGGSESDDDWNW